jgi:putative ABC transport system permease protein
MAMLFAALRDMQWRRRRLVIAIVSTGLVFAMTLVMTGLANGFRVEAQRTVDSIGVDTFVIKAGAAGPFLGATPFAQAELAQVAASPGVVAAAPLACAASTVKDGTSRRNVTAFGAPEHGPGMPRIPEGRAPSTPDEAAVSSTLGRRVGDELRVGAFTLRVVGIVPNSTAMAKMPNIFLTTEGVQRLAYNGQPMISSIAIEGTPRQLPDGVQVVDRAVGLSDLLRPLKVAWTSISIVAGLLWIVAALAGLCSVQGDRCADAVDSGRPRAAGRHYHIARGGAGGHLFAVARPGVSDACCGAGLCLPGAAGGRDCDRSAG